MRILEHSTTMRIRTWISSCRHRHTWYDRKQRTILWQRFLFRTAEHQVVFVALWQFETYSIWKDKPSNALFTSIELLKEWMLTVGGQKVEQPVTQIWFLEIQHPQVLRKVLLDLLRSFFQFITTTPAWIVFDDSAPDHQVRSLEDPPHEAH